MPRGEPFECRGLVGSVVIDVHAWVLLPSLHDEVNEVFKHLLLFGSIQRPSRMIASVGQHIPEQIFQPASHCVRIAFDVKEDVAVARFRKPIESFARFGWQELGFRFARTNAFELDLGLVVYSLIGRWRSLRGVFS